MKNRVSITSLLVALGIVYGDIGTSPLYVIKSMIGVNNGLITKDLVYGGISLVFWTLTIQTTIKYVLLTLQADNKGEGGIFSLYTLLRKCAKWLIIPAIIGGASLLADGMITPPVTVTSAIEGLNLVIDLKETTIITIVIIILTCLFSIQRFGTDFIGKIFGPMMFIWFTMLAILGISHIIHYKEIFAAINPYYGIKLLITSPKSVYILGAVFLCTTGAEALYSDLGHCGRRNIHYTWIFVKICIVLNYFGQGAYLMMREGQVIKDNPFFLVMPTWFIVPGVIISTIAAIIASQALISGSFTLVSEAIKLNIFPKLQVKFQNEDKGKLYIPAVNWVLYIGCVMIVSGFRKSSNMEAAYGLAITITMLMTTILLSQYIKFNKNKATLSKVTFIVFGTIEGSFLYANLFKFMHGGYVTIIIAGLLAFLMYIWIKGTNIKQRYTQWVKIDNYKAHFQALKEDKAVPLFCTNLVYLSDAKIEGDIENKIIYSIFNKQPKRARFYWFVNVKVTDEPYTKEYSVETIVPNEAYVINFRLGFRIDQKVNEFLGQIIQDLVKNKEIIVSPKKYWISMGDKVTVGDFKFVILEEILPNFTNLSKWDNFIMSTKLLIKHFTASQAKWYGIDTSVISVEKVPVIAGSYSNEKLIRIND